MSVEVHCDCGYVAASSEGNDDLMAATREHAWAAHGTHLTPEVILSLVRRTDDEPTTRPRAK